MKELYKRRCSWIIILIMVMSMLQVPKSAKVVSAATTTLSNPRIVADSSMKSGQKVTWDTITFGTYPQSEVMSDDEIYDELLSATDWDEHQEIVIDGKKYRRMMEKDATFVPVHESPCYYQWEDEEIYHYFLYEPIQWRVLHIEDDKALVLSEFILDNQENYRSGYPCEWEDSQVRSWLNGYGADVNEKAIDYSNNNFINSAFSAEEQATIIQYTEEDIEEAYVGTGMEDDTTDKLFLLSANEVYLNEEAQWYGFVRDKKVYDEARWCHSSDYAKAQGLYIGDSTNFSKNSFWCLRAGTNKSNGCYVYDSGMVASTRKYEENNVGIRVALNIDLSKAPLFTLNGTVCSNEYKISVESRNEKIEGELCNPRIEADNTAFSERKTTWDCVWLGSYPQTEITDGDDVYDVLKEAEDWDENNDITIEGMKYRRMLKSDSLETELNTTEPDSLTKYYWSDDTTYHYFRYDPIKWRVLQVEGQEAYIVADIVLDYQIFGGNDSINCWWQYSSIRSWLNGYPSNKNWAKIDYSINNFISSAFKDYEEEAIIKKTVSEPNNLFYDNGGNESTTDKIHLLAESEVYGTQKSMDYGFGAAYSVDDESRSAICSTYAKAKGAATGTTGLCPNWLRSVQAHGNYIMSMQGDGSVNIYGINHINALGVRPTLYLDISRTSAYVYAGEVSSDGTVKEEENTGASGDENGGLHNPVILKDDSLKAGQKTIWDCITFGSYPQSEVTKQDAVYEKLVSGSDWDENGNIIIDGIRYRRALASDAGYVREKDYTRGYYLWEDDTTYHYFKYEPIKWRILRVDNNQALLLSDIALDNKSFLGGSSYSWETSTIRNWLNGYSGTYVENNFMDSAFSEKEQNSIIPYNEADSCDGTEEENAITDKVFLLSTAEVSSSEKATKYGFVNGTIGNGSTVDESRRAHSSDFAKAMGVYSISSSVYENNCFWWTRSCFSSSYRTISTVTDNGCVIACDHTKANTAVRMALNLDLLATDLYSYVGTVSTTDNIKLIENSDTKPENRLSNPVIVSDYSTISGKITTWDCIWYGKYPQSEITSENSVYQILNTTTDWDEHDDVIIEDTKYRRLLKNDMYRYFIYEPIKWRILQVDDEQMLLLADKALDMRAMDATYTTQAWDVSTMRSWLNGNDGTQNRDGIDFSDNNFISTALSAEEQGYIVKSKVDSAISMYCVESEIDCGKNTLDSIFLLADSEVYGTTTAQSYGFDGSFTVRDEARHCQGSEYVQARGLSSYTVAGKSGYVAWWTRTQGHSQSYVTSVSSSGNVVVDGTLGGSGIRPAMRVSLKGNKLYSYAGTVCSDGTELEEERTEEGDGTAEDDETGEGDGTVEDGEIGEGDGTVEDGETGEGDGTVEDGEIGEGDGTVEDGETGEGDGTVEDGETGEGDGTVEDGETEEGDGTAEDDETEEGDGTVEDGETGEGDGTVEDGEIEEGDGTVEDGGSGEDNGTVEDGETEEGDGTAEDDETEEGNGTVEDGETGEDNGTVEDDETREDDGTVEDGEIEEDNGTVEDDEMEEGDGIVEDNETEENDGTVEDGECDENNGINDNTGDDSLENGESDTTENGGLAEDTQVIPIQMTTVISIPVQIYCGQGITPLPTLSYNGMSLVVNRDYTLTYQNNVNVGTAQVIIHGSGNYKGTKIINFDIVPFDASKLSTTLKGKDGQIYRATYTKKVIKLKTAFKIATTNNGKKVYLQPKEGTDYSVRFKNNKKIGTASIIYTFKGNYTGTLVKNFQIVPPATKVVSVKKSGLEVVIKWKKVSSCDRYEVYCATSKNGKYKKIATVKGKNKCIYKDKKAKKGKKYYYKVKACKKVKGKIYKSDFSNVKKGKR